MASGHRSDQIAAAFQQAPEAQVAQKAATLKGLLKPTKAGFWDFLRAEGALSGEEESRVAFGIGWRDDVKHRERCEVGVE